MMAAVTDYDDVATLLLDNGANLEAKNNCAQSI